MATTSNSSNSAEPLPSKTSLKLAELRSRVLIGELPEDFLRIPVPSEDVGEQNALTHQQQQQMISQQHQQQVVHPQQYLQINPAEHFYSFMPPHTRGRIAVKIVEAKLTKNYGLPGVRMDPYVRVRIGNTLFETPTCVNGGKTPHWNRTVNAYLPDGVESVYLQIYDERSFTNDECVAWAHIILPQGVFSQEVIDDWYQLSGPQGEGKEGVINLVISFTPVVAEQPGQVAPQPADGQQQQQQGATEPTIVAFTEADLDEMQVKSREKIKRKKERQIGVLQEMFPSIDRDVIRTVMEANRGNKDATVNALIEMAN